VALLAAGFEIPTHRGAIRVDGTSVRVLFGTVEHAAALFIHSKGEHAKVTWLKLRKNVRTLLRLPPCNVFIRYQDGPRTLKAARATFEAVGNYWERFVGRRHCCRSDLDGSRNIRDWVDYGEPQEFQSDPDLDSDTTCGIVCL